MAANKSEEQQDITWLGHFNLVGAIGPLQFFLTRPKDRFKHSNRDHLSSVNLFNVRNPRAFPMALSGRLRSSLSLFHQILRAESSLPLRSAAHRGSRIPNIVSSECLRNFATQAKSSETNVKETKLQILRELAPFQNGLFRSGVIGNNSFCRSITTVGHTEASSGQDNSASPDVDRPQRIKFKRLDKTAKHIMNILDKEAVESVRTEREIPDIRPGYIVQLKVEVPENKRRVSVLKGIIIARRNAGLNTTFRLRRLVAGVGVESVFPLYSPNIKEMKVLDKKKVRRAKLYYLRDRMNPLKK